LQLLRASLCARQLLLQLSHGVRQASGCSGRGVSLP
jgi:hypothetical protein